MRPSAQARKHTNNGIHPGFETQGRRHQKSKTGVSVTPQKGLVSYKNLKRKKKKKKLRVKLFTLTKNSSGFTGLVSHKLISELIRRTDT